MTWNRHWDWNWHDKTVAWHDMTKGWPLDRWKEKHDKTNAPNKSKKEVRQKQANYHSNHPFTSRLIQDKSCFQKSNKANMPIMYRSKRRNAASKQSLQRWLKQEVAQPREVPVKKSFDTLVFAVLFVWTVPIENSRGMTCHQGEFSTGDPRWFHWVCLKIEYP